MVGGNRSFEGWRRLRPIARARALGARGVLVLLPAVLAGCNCDCPERMADIRGGAHLEGFWDCWGGITPDVDVACTVESVAGEDVHLRCDEAGSPVSQVLRVSAVPSADLGFLTGLSVTLWYHSQAWTGCRLTLTAGADGVVLASVHAGRLPTAIGSLQLEVYDANCAQVENECGGDERVGVRLTDGNETVEVFDGNVGDLVGPRPTRMWVGAARRNDVMFCTDTPDWVFELLLVRPPVR